jgi:histone-lysine N-methyltransferase SETMAR
LQKFAGKFLASIVWNQDGIILSDYFPKCQTINAEYYSSMQVQLKDIFKHKDHEKYTKGVLFWHYCAPTNRALALQKKLAYQGFQCLDHPSYSPYLAPSDYQLFHGLYKQLKSRQFSCDAQVIAAAGTWMEEQNSEIFLSG